jgi:hypothetical protein
MMDDHVSGPYSIVLPAANTQPDGRQVTIITIATDTNSYCGVTTSNGHGIRLLGTNTGNWVPTVYVGPPGTGVDTGYTAGPGGKWYAGTKITFMKGTITTNSTGSTPNQVWVALS